MKINKTEEEYNIMTVDESSKPVQNEVNTENKQNES